MSKEHEPFTGVDRLELLGYELLALTSAGKKETLEEIEKHLDSQDIIEYIRDKYKNDLFNTFTSDAPYKYEDWNKALGKYSGWIEGNESRKYGIVNENDGLLLLIALVLELVANREHDWTGLSE